MYSCFSCYINHVKPKHIIMDINPDNWTTYTRMGETNRYQYSYMFTMVKYCATELSVLPKGHQVFQWGVLAPLL